MSRLLLAAIALSIGAAALVGCVSHAENIRRKARGHAAVYGPSVDAPNDYSALKAELTKMGHNCTIEPIAGANLLRCPRAAHQTLGEMARRTGSMTEESDGVFRVTKSGNLQSFLGRIAKIRALEAAGKRAEMRAHFVELGVTPDESSDYGSYRAKHDADHIVGRVVEILRSMDDSRDAEAQAMLIDALKIDPKIGQTEAARQVLEAAIANYTWQLDCTLTVREPPGSVYASAGFSSPVSVHAHCSEGKLNGSVLALTKAVGAVGFGSDSRGQWISGFVNEQTELPITRLSTKKEDNRMTFAVRGALSGTVAVLKMFGIERSLQARLQPDSYTIERTPTYFSADYEEIGQKYPSQATWAEIRGKEGEFSVAANGQFTIGARLGNSAWDLLYGHPNGVLGEGIWSSFASVKIDERVYRLHSLPIIDRKKEPGSVSFLYREPASRTDILLSLTMHEDGSTIRVAVTLTNRDDRPHSLGVRLFMDTWGGNSMTCLFTIPGVIGQEAALVRSELKFNAIASPVWEMYDDGGAGVFIQNTLLGETLSPPDDVAFVSWYYGFFSDWDYPVNPDRRVDGSAASAVLWWHPRRIPPGKTLEASTRYGIVKRDPGMTFGLYGVRQGQVFLYLQHFNNSAANKNAKYKLVLDTGEMISGDRGPARELSFEYDAPAGQNLVRVIPLLILASSKTTLRVQEQFGDKTAIKELVLDLGGANRAAVPTVWSPTKRMPVRFYASTGDQQLYCEIRDSATQQIIARAKLSPRKVGAVFVYEADVAIPDKHVGQVVVDIFAE